MLKMSNKIEDIGIINRTYYFFGDVINIQNFYRNNIKTDEKSYKKNLFSTLDM